jgi:hypothetical protein
MSDFLRTTESAVRGPFILVPGVRRTEGRDLLRQMDKAAEALRTLGKKFLIKKLLRSL